MTPEQEQAAAANRAADGAAAEVGTGPVDTAVQGCGLVRYGMFFDGTGNSRDHVGGDFESWHTNVDLLERIYMPTVGGPEVTTVVGQPRQTVRLKRYMRGIGVNPDGKINNLVALPRMGFLPGPRGMGWGTGVDGVEARVDEAVSFALEDIRARAADVQPCDIWFDTFGFSRGAAAARYFANRVTAGDLGYGGARASTQFLGLFDTVSSVGNGGHTGNYGRMDISTPAGIAARIVHLTAKDEIRTYFPLTLALSGTRIELVGAHADIGGGYFPAGDVCVLDVPHELYYGVTDFYYERWTVGENGDSVTSRSIAMATDQYPRVARRFETTTAHGLQFVALRVMHREAVAAGVPFEPTIGTAIGPVSVAFPTPLLESYYAQLIASGYTAPTEMERQVRSVHGHFSASNNGFREELANMPVRTGRRVIDRM
jgi:hypothetical protein